MPRLSPTFHLALALAGAPALAQDTTTRAPTLPPARLPAVEVRVSRERARSPLDLPFAVSATAPDSLRPGLRHTALDETLFLLPGVTVVNRTNPTQDPRISIRGFGARSAFGVRGVRVMRDGIPLTLPDGQTPVDYLDLESVGRVEVIRGSASALYGNAAGGVIDVRSAEAPHATLAGYLRPMAGSYGLRRLAGSVGGRIDDSTPRQDIGALTRWSWLATGSRTEQEGYRRYSAIRSTNVTARVGLHGEDGEETVALHGMFYDTPWSDNPGALTRAQFRADPRAADVPSYNKRAGKAVRQHQLGLVVQHELAGADLFATAFGGRRTLDNPLTFAVVDVDRTSYGASIRATRPFRLLGLAHRVTAGADAQTQDDDRLNFENCIDITAATVACPTPRARRGNLRLDQRERVTSLGPYLRDEMAIGSRVRVSLGARADRVRFDVTDHFITATSADDSGERTLRAVSPMAGLVLRLGALTSLYANASTSFETPTATELANQPDGSAGINPDLRPQYATTYEAGAKGYLLSRLQYDVAAFLTGVRDELVPFDIPGGGGRRYFRNAGRTRRAGGETSLAAALGPLALNASYAYSAFRYTSYRLGTASFAGKRIPGIPMHQAQGSATLRSAFAGGAYLTVDGQVAGGAHVDDANTTRAPGYEVMNVRAGGTLRVGGSWVEPVVGVQNLFGRRYAPSLVVNAAAGKFYEPAAERSVYVGLTLGAGRTR